MKLTTIFFLFLLPLMGTAQLITGQTCQPLFDATGFIKSSFTIRQGEHIISNETFDEITFVAEGVRQALDDLQDFELGVVAKDGCGLAGTPDPCGRECDDDSGTNFCWGSTQGGCIGILDKGVNLIQSLPGPAKVVASFFGVLWGGATAIVERTVSTRWSCTAVSIKNQKRYRIFDVVPGLITQATIRSKADGTLYNGKCTGVQCNFQLTHATISLSLEYPANQIVILRDRDGDEWKCPREKFFTKDSVDNLGNQGLSKTISLLFQKSDVYSSLKRDGNEETVQLLMEKTSISKILNSDSCVRLRENNSTNVPTTVPPSNLQSCIKLAGGKQICYNSNSDDGELQNVPDCQLKEYNYTLNFYKSQAIEVTVYPRSVSVVDGVYLALDIGCSFIQFAAEKKQFNVTLIPKYLPVAVTSKLTNLHAGSICTKYTNSISQDFVISEFQIKVADLVSEHVVKIHASLDANVTISCVFSSSLGYDPFTVSVKAGYQDITFASTTTLRNGDKITMKCLDKEEQILDVISNSTAREAAIREEHTVRVNETIEVQSSIPGSKNFTSVELTGVLAAIVGVLGDSVSALTSGLFGLFGGGWFTWIKIAIRVGIWLFISGAYLKTSALIQVKRISIFFWIVAGVYFILFVVVFAGLGVIYMCSYIIVFVTLLPIFSPTDEEMKKQMKDGTTWNPEPIEPQNSMNGSNTSKMSLELKTPADRSVNFVRTSSFLSK